MKRKRMQVRRTLVGLAVTLLVGASAAASGGSTDASGKHAGGAARVPVAPVLAPDAATQRAARKPADAAAATAATPRLPIDAVRLDPEVRSTDFRGLQPTDAEIAALAVKPPRGGYIVTLDLAFTPEGLLEPATAAAQRAAIQALQQGVRTTVEAAGGKVRRRFETVPMISVEADAGALQLLARLPGVARIQPNAEYDPVLDVSVPLIGATDVQDRGYTGSDWAVAVIDTGIDRSHPFLRGFRDEACFTSENACPNGTSTQTGTGASQACTFHALCDHGTHVAGIATGLRFSSSDPQGVARGAWLMPIQAADRNPSTGRPTFYDDSLIAALEYVYGQRLSRQIAAVNLSIGGGAHATACDSEPIKPIIDQLRSAGIATVIAAGNNGYRNQTTYPGCISSAVTVGATDDADLVADFSNMASMVDLMAPGVDTVSSIPGGGFGPKSGTSMATPHVAGAFALMQQAAQNTVNVQETTLKFTGKSIADARSGGTLTKPRVQLLLATGLDYEVMVDALERNFRLPSPLPHNFRVDAPSDYWYAVALRPTAGLDVDLQLRRNSEDPPLAYSALPGDQVDFIALDRNRSVQVLAYPRATFYAGPADGRYTIELSDPHTTLGAVASHSFGLADVVRIWDRQVSAGQITALRAVPDPTLDVSLFVMESTAADNSTFAQGRAQARSAAHAGANGAAEHVYHLALESAWAGVVLVKEGGYGNVTLYTDTTPPVMSFTIDGGATQTPDREVTLDISTSDPQTGIDGMRVAMDGVLDTEVFEPYAASVTRLLPDTHGTHTVRVELRNRAWQSNITSRTIERPQGVLSLAIADGKIAEGNAGGPRLMKLVMTLSQPAPVNVLVRVQTSDGTARAGSDYTATDAEFRIRRGATTGAVFIPVLPDTLPEANEKFTVTIVGNNAGAVVSDGTALGVIRNDD